MNKNIITFSEKANELLVPAWKDYVANYRAVNFAKKNRYDVSKSLDEKQAMIDKYIESETLKCANMDENNLVATGAKVTNPVYQWAKFAVVNKLIDMVIPDIVRDDFMSIANVTNIGYGDSADFEIKSGDLFTVTKNGNSRRHVDAQRQFTGSKTLVPENHTITVEYDLYRMLAGKDSPAEYAMKVILSMESEIAVDIMSCITASYATLTSNWKEASFSESSFKKLAQRVSAANGGARAVAIGTDVAVGTLLPSNDYLKMELGEEYNKVGFLPIFQGVPVIGIAQKIDWDSADYDFALDDKYVYILSPQTQKLVQIVFEGDSLSINEGLTDGANLTIKNSLHKRWKVGLITNAHYGIVKVS
jgi:hypothetical protein